MEVVNIHSREYPVASGEVGRLVDTLSSENDLLWPLIFRPLHDALIEDSLCFAELRLNLTPTVSEWSWWVKFLRWAISGRKSRPQKIA